MTRDTLQGLWPQATDTPPPPPMYQLPAPDDEDEDCHYCQGTGLGRWTDCCSVCKGSGVR